MIGAEWFHQWARLPEAEQEQRIARVQKQVQCDGVTAALGVLAGVARPDCTDAEFRAEIGRRAQGAAWAAEHWATLKQELDAWYLWPWKEDGSPLLCPGSNYVKNLGIGAKRYLPAGAWQAMPAEMAGALRACAAGTAGPTDIVRTVAFVAVGRGVGEAAVLLLDTALPFACAGIDEAETAELIEGIRRDLARLLGAYDSSRAELAAADAWPWPDTD